MNKIFILFLIGIFLIGTISAFEFDNSLSYSEDKMIVKITNAFGLGDEIGEATLKSHTTPDEVLIVPTGKNQKPMFYDFNFSEEYENGLGEVEFRDLKTGNLLEKEYHFEIAIYGNLERTDYKTECNEKTYLNGSVGEVCEKKIIGSHIENAIVGWKELDRNIPSGFHRIALVTDVNAGDYIDGVWEIAGKKISEHASWTTELNNNLVAYYTLNETTGNYANNSVSNGTLNNGTIIGGITKGVAGKIGTAFQFDGANARLNLSTTMYNSTNGSLTFWFWVNFSRVTSVRTDYFWSMKDVGLTSRCLSRFEGGDLVWYCIDGGGQDFQLHGNPLANRSIFYALQWTNSGTGNATLWQGYENGSLAIADHDNTVAYSSVTYAENSIGNNSYNDADSGSFAGTIDEMGWHSGFYSPAQIVQLFNEGTGLTYHTENETGDSYPSVTLNSPANNTNFSVDSVLLNATATDDFLIHNLTIIFNGTSTNSTTNDATNLSELTFNVINLPDGTYNWSAWAYDNASQRTNSTVRTFTIDTTAPTLNISYPLNQTYYTNYTSNSSLTINLNWTAADTHLQACWYSLDSGFTNITITCGQNQTLPSNYTSRHLRVYANDTSGNEATANVTAKFSYRFLENNVTFNETSLRTNLEDFILNVSSDGLQIITAQLRYNGTNYAASKSGNDTTAIFNTSITMNQTGNISFHWMLVHGSASINSTTYFQNVTDFQLGLCGGTLNTKILNFTAWDEQTLLRLTPFDFFGTFNYWIGDGSIKNNFSISQLSANEIDVCLLENRTYYIDATIQYQKNETYITRSYYLTNESLTNDSVSHVELFFLNSSFSTSFIIELIDDTQLSISNAYIYMQKYFPGTNQIKTIEMGLTDSSGATIGHFEAETEEYRILAEKDNVIIYQSPTQKIFCRETPCTLTFQTAGGNGTTWTDYGSINKFSWDLNYTNATTLWAFTYTDTSGSIGSGRLYVYQENNTEASGKTTICNVTSTQVADTLTCNVAGYNGTIYAAAYLSRSPEVLVYFSSVIVAGIKAIFGLEGLFASFFILLVVAFAGLWNPVVGIMLLIAGMLALSLMGIASFGAVVIWGVIFIGLIIIWELRS